MRPGNPPAPTLWRHQAEALDFVRACWEDGRPGVMLALEMGTGKTAIAIHAMHAAEAQRVLVVSPKSVMSVWPAEFTKHWPGARPPAVVTLDGPTKRKQQQLASALTAVTSTAKLVVICNYESVWREPLASALVGCAWDTVVVDECHRAKSVSGRASVYLGKLAASATRRLGLTGTPTPNGPLDIWSQYRILDNRVFGSSYVSFRSRYTAPSGWPSKDGVTVGRGGVLQPYRHVNMDDYQRRLGTIAYQVRAGDVLDLPDAVDTDIEFALEPSAARSYRQMERDLMADVAGGVVTAANALVKLLRLQQLTGGWLRQDDGALVEVSRAKRDALADYLTDIDPTEAVVIFARFHSDMDAAHQVASDLGRGSLELSGRRRQLAEWQAGAAPILVVQPSAGGLGVSMTRARHAVWYSLSYSLADYLQARARLVRPGQERHVVFAHLIASGTIDRDVRQALAAKGDVMEAVLAALQTRP